MAISPRGDRLYLPDRSGNSLVVIDIALGDTVAIVYCDGAPTDVAVTQDGADVFMTVPERNAVEDVETATNTVVGSSPAIGAAAIANFVEPRPNRVFRSGFD
jgi:DNA-binding beta-propeller fold protein YncE